MAGKNKDEYKDKDEIIASKSLLILLNSILMLSFILLINPIFIHTGYFGDILYILPLPNERTYKYPSGPTSISVIPPKPDPNIN